MHHSDKKERVIYVINSSFCSQKKPSSFYFCHGTRNETILCWLYLVNGHVSRDRIIYLLHWWEFDDVNTCFFMLFLHFVDST